VSTASQYSAMSQTPADGRHSVVLGYVRESERGGGEWWRTRTRTPHHERVLRAIGCDAVTEFFRVARRHSGATQHRLRCGLADAHAVRCVAFGHSAYGGVSAVAVVHALAHVRAAAAVAFAVALRVDVAKVGRHARRAAGQVGARAARRRRARAVGVVVAQAAGVAHHAARLERVVGTRCRRAVTQLRGARCVSACVRARASPRRHRRRPATRGTHSSPAARRRSGS
jgi:hypothetical protein